MAADADNEERWAAVMMVENTLLVTGASHERWETPAGARTLTTTDSTTELSGTTEYVALGVSVALSDCERVTDTDAKTEGETEDDAVVEGEMENDAVVEGEMEDDAEVEGEIEPENVADSEGDSEGEIVAEADSDEEIVREAVTEREDVTEELAVKLAEMLELANLLAETLLLGALLAETLGDSRVADTLGDLEELGDTLGVKLFEAIVTGTVPSV